MTYPPGGQMPWGQPIQHTPPQPQEIPPLGPPPKSNAGWIVVAVVLVVGLLGGAGLLVLGTRDAVPGTAVAASGLVPATTTERTAPTTTTAKKPVSAGAKLSYTEYEGPWDFKLGDVELHADWVEGRDNDSCAPIERDGALTAAGCQYAAELVHSAESGGLRLTQFILAMPDAAAAKSAAADFDQKSLKPRAGTTIDDFATGKFKTGSQDQFVVITLATATSAVDEATVTKYLGYRHSDILGALLFR
ncbi:hypothetical protein [Nocardia rhizosphaerae]|uniref:Uncharacterized protein n=1 Tax=Nocardia rhizosphaerae TaxID=1691571 RepID=A0ABV8L0D4_9NOCA